MVAACIGQTRFFLLDTPGFDDTNRSNSEVLIKISEALAALHQSGMKLKGAIYLHRATDPKFQGSSRNTLEIFNKICGEKALKNVVLATTRWDDIDEAIGAERERELRENFWAYMLGKGSTMNRFHGDRSSAIVIASQLLNKRSIILDLQREIVDQGKSLNETAAGALVNDNIAEMKERFEQELQGLKNLEETLKENDQATRQAIQRDWEREQSRLQEATEEQERLKRDINSEVRNRLDDKRSSLSKLGTIVPSALALLSTVLDIILGQ